MEFEDYCKSKKIDSVIFKRQEPERWKELSFIFSQVSPESFTQQKKFLLNELRRLYLYKETEIAPVKPAEPKKTGC
jgi:hypothetical protein